jgi:YfiH family protein
VSTAHFERSASFLGLDHGFGQRESAQHAPAGLALVRQVHGDRTLRVREPGGGREADALFTSEPGLAVGVWTADCVPILLAHVDGGAVAAVHAGWRGSALAIARKAVLAMAETLGFSARGFTALIGPHIGPCCYEVDGPVLDAIGDATVFSPGRRADRYQLDLEALNRKQLLEAGLRPERVARVGGCTACDASRYASFRRDGGGGRMLHYVRMPSLDGQ